VHGACAVASTQGVCLQLSTPPVTKVREGDDDDKTKKLVFFSNAQLVAKTSKHCFVVKSVGKSIIGTRVC